MNGFYINLTQRIDRKKHIELLQKNNLFFSNIQRMDAIYSKQYGVGCCASHIKCLEECLKLNNNYYLIMEDDFTILHQEYFNNFVNEFEKIKDDIDWDIITLTPRGITEKKQYKPYFNKIIKTQTTTGYIIKHTFIEKLLSVLQNGLIGLIKGYSGPNPNPYCCDQCWKPLQLTSNWLYYNKIFAGQLPGYSDIEQKNVNYNKRFLEQLYY
jgi:GR25 family glycosyltransferase involved in LPS biosynthesis